MRGNQEQLLVHCVQQRAPVDLVARKNCHFLAVAQNRDPLAEVLHSCSSLEFNKLAQPPVWPVPDVMAITQRVAECQQV